MTVTQIPFFFFILRILRLAIFPREKKNFKLYKRTYNSEANGIANLFLVQYYAVLILQDV